jgi:glycosyltransferase involved in cell wall biosynthesis
MHSTFLQNKPLVSIALATYNGEKYIQEQLNSLFNQTYKHIEIVVVDDCSKDATVSIIKHYQQQYSNISLLVNEHNSGVTKTFENAIRNCNGEFTALCDQDDYWLPQKIETLVQAIGNHDGVYSNSLLVDAHLQSLGKSFNSIMHMQSYYTGSPFLHSNSVPGHTMLLKKEFIEKVLPIPANVLFDLWLGYCAAANNGLLYVDEVLVHYRQHSSNAIGTKDSANKKLKRTTKEEFEFKRKELATLATAPITNKHTQQIHRGWSLNRCLFFFKNLNEILASKQKPYYRKVLYCIKMFFKPNY